MHEFGIAEAILTAVEKRADGRRVRRARVHAGALLRITEPVINQAFSAIADGSVAEGAQVDLVIVPVRMTCRSCGSTSASVDPFTVCAGCGGTDIDTEGGDDLVLESIQMAEAAHVPGNSRGDRGNPVGPS
ncbi:hydrogenase maturation nickel metallochaperone HypA [Streptosporangium sp. NBC_01755]|uniref:hydrogenase maturation nickel metallochaperone HypA/HybF n=1 Tax=unclassified Streptosporangium TaxID=2632669 RepID=UPI002DDAD8DC|nr:MULTISPECIES: hydrogenase maturation nickel metallochaperone HypA [unclassified Streptosporangium]WSA27004.1 hydrogenase maturation nickel metallochaperone HypA [Streptosporangium sp. NBC_01810]WSD01584.1 hydrogenase maturation nickel metallochaperone HypA [Streptosporangium sp. NBC_01755]